MLEEVHTYLQIQQVSIGRKPIKSAERKYVKEPLRLNKLWFVLVLNLIGWERSVKVFNLININNVIPVYLLHSIQTRSFLSLFFHTIILLPHLISYLA